jgi:hypothetical protein
MPRYFLHVNNSIGFVEDEEGVELPDLDAAREKAAAGVRSIIADEVLHGRADLRGRIDVADEEGRVLLSLPFGALVEVLTD